MYFVIMFIIGLTLLSINFINLAIEAIHGIRCFINDEEYESISPLSKILCELLFGESSPDSFDIMILLGILVTLFIFLISLLWPVVVIGLIITGILLFARNYKRLKKKANTK